MIISTIMIDIIIKKQLVTNAFWLGVEVFFGPVNIQVRMFRFSRPRLRSDSSSRMLPSRGVGVPRGRSGLVVHTTPVDTTSGSHRTEPSGPSPLSSCRGLYDALGSVKGASLGGGTTGLRPSRGSFRRRVAPWRAEDVLTVCVCVRVCVCARMCVLFLL